jgi:uncharacterized protein (TIGR02266 family)
MVDYSNIPRDSRRVPLETRVQFKFDRFDGFISEYSANISPGGLFLRTRAPQPPGTILDFEFRLGDGFELIRGRGEVVWNRLEDEGPARPAGMGLRFLQLSEGSKDLIYRIVDQHVLHGGTPFDVTQRPPDPVPLSTAPAVPQAPWPRPAPLTSRDVFDLPPPPAVPDTSSWLPSIDEPSDFGDPVPADEPLAALGPPSPPASVPDAPPMFSSTFGHAAAAARPGRRKLPWVLLAAGVVLAAGLFLLRDRVIGWIGLGEDDRIAQAPPPSARPKKPRRTALPGAPPPAAPGAETAPSVTTPPAAAASAPPLESAGGAAPQTSAAPPAAAPAAAPAPRSKTPPPAAAPPAPAPAPLPAPAAGKRAPFPAVPEDAGPPLTALEKITFEPAGGGTDVILWGNGAIPASVYARSRIDGNPPRELFRLSGILQPFARTRVVVGTPEVLQVRTGFHSGAHGNELHVVLDLATPGVTVTQVESGPQRLRIHLQKK